MAPVTPDGLPCVYSCLHLHWGSGFQWPCFDVLKGRECAALVDGTNAWHPIAAGGSLDAEFGAVSLCIFACSGSVYGTIGKFNGGSLHAGARPLAGIHPYRHSNG